MKLDKNKHRPFVVEDYDPNWVLRFEEIKKDLLKVFGSKAEMVEHIGSTSIVGMKAKPVIDVLVVVDNVESLEEEIKGMELCGYLCGRDYIAPRTIIFFKENEQGQKTINIHVCEEDSYKIKQFLTTRDYLRSHPDRAKLYSDLKEKNAELYKDDYPSYRLAKQEFVDETERLANEWLKDND
ncbi:GrpB family protein [Candidatus Nomurabacteria bacterium]|nr:GrpB family protein [Candidatus Nomurabacteria bacterium]